MSTTTPNYEVQLGEALAALEALVAAAETALTELGQAASAMTLGDAVQTAKAVQSKIKGEAS